MVKSGTMLHRIGYCDTVEQLLKILVTVTAKVDTLVHSDAMVRKYRECDELIQQLIIRELAADIGKVAQVKLVQQLQKMNA